MGSLLFNIDLFDLFLIINYEHNAYYADENKICVSKENDEVIFLEIVENCGNWSKTLYWETYRTNLCKNKGWIKSFSKNCPFKNIHEKKVLLKAFFTAQFRCCLLTWMFHRRMLSNKFIRFSYFKRRSYFKELSETDNSISLYHRNIQVLATELYKIVNRNSPEIMEEIFPFNENHFRSAHAL